MRYTPFRNESARIEPLGQESCQRAYRCATRSGGSPQKPPALMWRSGHSFGGIITAGLIQRHPDRFDAALPMCSVLSGGVATWNTALDFALALCFVTLAGWKGTGRMTRYYTRQLRTAIRAGRMARGRQDRTGGRRGCEESVSYSISRFINRTMSACSRSFCVLRSGLSVSAASRCARTRIARSRGTYVISFPCTIVQPLFVRSSSS